MTPAEEGLRITDAATLECVIDAVGHLRIGSAGGSLVGNRLGGATGSTIGAGLGGAAGGAVIVPSRHLLGSHVLASASDDM